MTPDGHLDNFSVRAGHQKDQPRDKRAGTFSHSASREGEWAGDGVQSHGQ